MHKSPNDNNEYCYITLPNQLRVLLIHAPSAQKSAAALSVKVGHFDDPIERQGMAHYLEHMLFLGTEKYPKTGEFQTFISQHGGTNNAWTGTEHSCFFFDVDNQSFDKALDRFSQFFLSPLFSADALDKERQAVDSEFKMKLHDDSRRLYQVHKETINPAHPFAKFSVGNLHTLADRPATSLRDEVIAFYHQFYSADIMTLALIGPQSIEELRQRATQYFAAITNRQQAEKTIAAPFVLKEHCGLMLHVEPLKETRKLILSFPLPSTDDFYRDKPLSYFAHLLGYEGEGSLFLALRDKQWITSLSAGGGVSGSNYREFSISCTLTKQGLKRVDDIIQALFYTLKLIAQQGLNLWRYQEKRSVLESVFQFQETSRPIDIVSHLVINMQHYAPEDTIYGDYMMQDYNEDQLKQVLGYLVPENLRATLVARGLSYDRTTDWYHTPYSCRPFTQQQLTHFTDSPSDLAIILPSKNPFIADNMTMQPPVTLTETPTIIEELPGFRLWHQQETEFAVPKGVIYIAIDSPHAVASHHNIVMTRLCVEMFLDRLATETYQAEIAGMSYNLYTHQGGVTLSLSGFNQKQPQLLAMILEKFAQRDFKADRFASIKQQLARNWRNAAQDRPISQLFNTMTGLLQPNNPPYSALLNALNDIELEQLAPFVELILSKLHIEMFVYGNWLAQDALAMGEMLKNALRVNNQTYQESLRPLISLGEHGTFQHQVCCQQDDSAVVVYYQSSDSEAKSIALYSLANHLMSAAFFHEIRTKQQLGYMVGTGNMPLNRHPGMVLYVQSPNADPNELIHSIDEFLNAFYMLLLELNEYQWHSSKRGLWNQIAAPDPTLRSRAQRLWVAIGNKDWSFDQREKVLDELKRLSRSDMIRFVVNQLKPRTANRLIMHTQGQAHHDAATFSIGQPIDSIAEFQLRPKVYDLG